MSLFFHPYSNHSLNTLFYFITVIVNTQHSVECQYISNLIAHISVQGLAAYLSGIVVQLI